MQIYICSHMGILRLAPIKHVWNMEMCVFKCVCLCTFFTTFAHHPFLLPQVLIGQGNGHRCIYSALLPHFKLREAFVTKNSSHIIKSNSLFGSSYVVFAKSETASHPIERSNGCTRGSIHISLNISNTEQEA